MRFPRMLLGVVLAVGFAAASVRAAEVEPLLPATTEQVVHFNIKQILDSEIIKKFAMDKIKEGLEKDNAKELLKDLGLDPLKDISTATLGLWGEDAQNQNTLGVLHGTFDAKKMFAAAEKYSKDHADKLSIVEEGDYKLVKIIGQNDKPMFAAVVDNATIVVGSDKKLVAEALTAAVKKAKPALNKDLTALVTKQDEKASMFMCGITEGKFKDVTIPMAPIPGFDPEKVKDGLSKMNNISVTLRLGKEINLDFAMGMKDADAADDFGATMSKLIDTAKTFLPLLAMNNANAAPLVGEITNSLKSKVKEKEITLVVKVTADAISKATGKDDQ